MIVLTLLLFLAAAYCDVKNRNRYFHEIKRYIPKFTNVLDFGAGRCELGAYLKNRNYVTSVDIYKGCEDAVVYDGHTLPFADDAFDVVVCMFVLHHIPHHRQIIQELKRVCAKRIIIIEDMPQTVYQYVISKLHYLFFRQPMSTIKNMHSPQTWCDLLEGNGSCTIEQLKSHSWINPTPHFVIVKDTDNFPN
jgi:2-polyprenyl-3-methyl-5-hydroxy-6-metoxy-1,4-benzoquinol methylase